MIALILGDAGKKVAVDGNETRLKLKVLDLEEEIVEVELSRDSTLALVQGIQQWIGKTR